MDKAMRGSLNAAQAAAYDRWSNACDLIDRLVFPSSNEDQWKQTVAERDAAFQEFMMLATRQ